MDKRDLIDCARVIFRLRPHQTKTSLRLLCAPFLRASDACVKPPGSPRGDWGRTFSLFALHWLLHGIGSSLRPVDPIRDLERPAGDGISSLRDRMVWLENLGPQQSVANPGILLDDNPSRCSPKSPVVERIWHVPD